MTNNNELREAMKTVLDLASERVADDANTMNPDYLEELLRQLAVVEQFAETLS